MVRSSAEGRKNFDVVIHEASRGNPPEFSLFNEISETNELKYLELPEDLLTQMAGRFELEREMYVYTPPGYSAKKKYPVLYLLGGSGELASTWWIGGRHAQLVGFKCLDLFASFGILSAGDPESEKSTPEFLNDPNTNKKVDYSLLGLGTHENQPENRSVVFHQILERHNIKHDYYYGGNGAHDWATWRHLSCARLLPNLWRK
jgi:hypothetical protein